MSFKNYSSLNKSLAEPEFGRTKKIYVWEHGDVYSKCYELYINPNQLRTWNAILTYVTHTLNPTFGAIRRLVSIKTKKCVQRFKDLDNNGRYIAVGPGKRVRFSADKYKTGSEMEVEIMSKKAVKRLYSGVIEESEFKFLSETKKKHLTIIFVLVNDTMYQVPSKVVLTSKDLLVWDVILKYLSVTLDVLGDIQCLCTIYGDVIMNPCELQHGYVYVALPCNQKFVPMNYMKFFTEWENSAKKKGFLCSIRPATEKFHNMSYKKVKKKQLLEIHNLYTALIHPEENVVVAYSGIGDRIQTTKGINELASDIVAAVSGNEKFAELKETEGAMKSHETQTKCVIQNDTVKIGSKIYILINLEEYNKHKAVCSELPEMKTINDVISGGNSISVENSTDHKQITDSIKMNIKKQLISQSKASLDNTQNDGVEYISIIVIITKSSKRISKSTNKKEISNSILNKKCEAHTYCSEIAVSGTLSAKLEIITRVANDAIMETYQSLIQKQNNNLKIGNQMEYIDSVKQKIIAAATDLKMKDNTGATEYNNSIATLNDNNEEIENLQHNLKKKKTSVNTDNSGNDNNSADNNVPNDGIGENINDENSELNGNKDNKDSDNNDCTNSGSKNVPSLCIENKTYIHFCDFVNSGKNRPCENIKIMYCNSSEKDHTKNLEYQCCFCGSKALRDQQNDLINLPRKNNIEPRSVKIKENVVDSVKKNNQTVSQETDFSDLNRNCQYKVRVEKETTTESEDQNNEPVENMPIIENAVSSDLTQIQDIVTRPSFTSKRNTYISNSRELLEKASSNSLLSKSKSPSVKNMRKSVDKVKFQIKSEDQANLQNLSPPQPQDSVLISSELFTEHVAELIDQNVQEALSEDSISGNGLSSERVSTEPQKFLEASMVNLYKTKSAKSNIPARSVSFVNDMMSAQSSAFKSADSVSKSSKSDINSNGTKINSEESKLVESKQVEKDAEIVSITVNISRADKPNKSVVQQNNVKVDNGTDNQQNLKEENGVYSSTAMVNGLFSENSEIIKGIINDILLDTYERTTQVTNYSNNVNGNNLIVNGTNVNENLINGIKGNVNDANNENLITNGESGNIIMQQADMPTNDQYTAAENQVNGIQKDDINDDNGKNGKSTVQQMVVPDSKIERSNTSGSQNNLEKVTPRTKKLPKKIPPTQPLNKMAVNCCTNCKPKKETSPKPKKEICDLIRCLCKEDVAYCICSKQSKKKRGKADIENKVSKNKKIEKNKDLEVEETSSESELSEDSIDGACCICVCSPKYSMKIKNAKLYKKVKN